MKLSDNDKFPIFEIYHNDIKIIINIVCYMGDKETNFILDSISAKNICKYENNNNIVYYYDDMYKLSNC